MRRREFIAGVIGAAAWPLGAHAQPGRIPRVGLLMLGTPDPGVFLQELTAALRELGYEDGRNIVLEPRNAKGSATALDSLARELATLPVDAIVAFQTPVVAAARAATAQIPIVMCPAQEPVELGFVQSFDRPGGNITGMTTATAQLAGKNLELMREVFPEVARATKALPLENVLKPSASRVRPPSPSGPRSRARRARASSCQSRRS